MHMINMEANYYVYIFCHNIYFACFKLLLYMYVFCFICSLKNAEIKSNQRVIYDGISNIEYK